MAKILFIGAGAIGRGYMPWVFRHSNYDYIFVDNNPQIIEMMQQHGQATSFMTRAQGVDRLTYKIAGAYDLQQFSLSDHSDIVAAFVNVGPRNCVTACQILKGFKGPIILNENEPRCVDDVRNSIGSPNVFFGIPDVITSNTAPSTLLDEDPLAVMTEDGVLFVDEGARTNGLEGDLTFLDNAELIHKQWTAKLYIHNTPHCVAAYLGALLGKTYLHEGMEVPEIYRIVEMSMNEMLSSLKLNWDIPHDFLDWYAAKELRRFSNKSLFDPISRVAREPLRKLELNGRLLGAANICLSQGFIPEGLLKGIASALLFSSASDADAHLDFIRRTVDPHTLLTHVLSLRKGEALEILLSQRINGLFSELEEIVSSVKGQRVDA